MTYRTEFIGTRRGYDASSEPVTNALGEEYRATRRYSSEVGEVLATSDSLTPAYRLQGDELYVRAVVTSDEPPEFPVWEGQMQQAWTQPVGWR